MSEIRVNTIANAEGIAAPTLPYGVQIPTGMGITGAGGVNVSGALTASNFSGNLTGLINSAGVSTIARLEATKDINVGAAVTVAGIAKVSNTTASTSSSTGALIVSGGAGIGGDVFIGAGLSVAGTLTYQDVTEIDAVGLITAQGGVNISGGELKVGSALTVSGVGVATFIGAAGVAVTITPSTGKVQATAFEGPLTGNLTGTVNTAAQTSITSVGTLAGLTVGSAGEFKVGTGVTIASTAGVTTFSKNVIFTGLGGKSCTWNTGNGAFELEDNALLKIGSGADLKLYHDTSNSYIDNATGALYLRTSTTDKAVVCTADGGVALHWDDAQKYTTTGAGSTSVGISTFQDFSSVGMLKERVKVVANKLSAGTNVDVADGNIHYYTTNETSTATPNIRYDGTYSLNNRMLIGDTISVNIIYKPNGAGYYAALTVDGSAVTEEWNGGAAPSAANAGGYDVLTHTLVKTADATFLCLSNVSNFA